MSIEQFYSLNNDLMDLAIWRVLIKINKGTIVATNGCFDILHVGHIRLLEEARKLGDKVVVGLNSDVSVRALKGNNRPINSELDRKEVLMALKSVDMVSIFHTTRADNFLTCLQPDIYIKSGDYTLDTLDPIEREVLLRMGTKIYFAPYVSGVSTTEIIKKAHER